MIYFLLGGLTVLLPTIIVLLLQRSQANKKRNGDGRKCQENNIPPRLTSLSQLSKSKDSRCHPVFSMKLLRFPAEYFLRSDEEDVFHSRPLQNKSTFL